jgi:hypothetical protein
MYTRSCVRAENLGMQGAKAVLCRLRRRRRLAGPRRNEALEREGSQVEGARLFIQRQMGKRLRDPAQHRFHPGDIQGHRPIVAFPRGSCKY